MSLRSGGRRGSVAFFIILGAGIVGGALALNVGWVIVSWRQAGLLLLGILVFPLIITGVVLNTIFLVREIRRNDQHEAFINAVTHELKTPVASLKLYLQTLQNHHVDEAKRQEFYRTMLEDSDRLLVTIDQVLRAGQIGARVRHGHRLPVDVSALVQECLALARTRYRLPPEALTYRESWPHGAERHVLGNEDELQVVVSNLVDNAIKYSGAEVRVAVELEQTDQSRIALRVRDKGIGMQRQRLRRPGPAASRAGTAQGRPRSADLPHHHGASPDRGPGQRDPRHHAATRGAAAPQPVRAFLRRTTDGFPDGARARRGNPRQADAQATRADVGRRGGLITRARRRLRPS